MTLLDTLVALVILGLAGVGFLEAFQGTAHSTRDAEAWMEAVARAEAAMEETKLGTGPADLATTDPASALPSAVDVRPWPEAPGLELVTVTVALPNGGEFVLQRLARTR
ncbi:MAG: type II secretion system protein [Gemmatimonadetes bacterium]|nr:type II secretion system protein [Gemmatimonadota bacterium]